MASRLKVDDVRYELNSTTGMLSVWLYNDANYYEKRPNVPIAAYDFGLHYDERGLTTDRKAKLDKGLYREPFRDGWKYRLNIRLHPMMYETLMRYIRYGWKTDENGQRVPFTTLRHNHKALGIAYLFERYLECKRECEAWNAEFSKELQHSYDYTRCLADFFKPPYFPTPETYKGVNIARKPTKLHSRKKA